MPQPSQTGPFRPTSSQFAYTAAPSSPSSPDTNANAYSNLGGQNLPDSAFLSPEQVDNAPFFGRRGSAQLPAPSIISRSSLMLPGTPNIGGNRSSWSSSAGLAGAEAPLAGAEVGRHPYAPRGQSNLTQTTLGWNDTGNDRTFATREEMTERNGNMGAGAASGNSSERVPRWASGGHDPKKRRKWLWIGIALAALLAVGLAVGLGVGLSRRLNEKTVSRDPAQDNSGATRSASASGTMTATASTSAPSATPTSGGQGSLITFEDGSTMTYNNPFGGQWVWDPANPFNNDAQCNSWTPALSQNWTWGVDKIYGVNLGGWLNTEPFIVPALYEKYAVGPNNQTAIDEYTLSQNMGSNLTAAMTEHYATFITEQDFAEIASAGLNWVRIAVPHWAIETWEEEPYLEHVAWTYFLKAIQWSRKYGIRINFDLHTIPGSQNGWNHSGRLGSINWMYGIMGTANAQRALDYIRTLAQFISQPEYSPVIQIYSFINEPNGGPVGKPPIGSFYYEAYQIIRDITGIGEGNGAVLSMQDAFLGITSWYGFLPGADRLALDQHSYLVFGNQSTASLDAIAKFPCQYWGEATNVTSQTWGLNIAGEWSAASNDCGLWVNDVGVGSRYDGSYKGYNGPTPGSCAYWNDYTLWNQSTKADILHFVEGSMDAFQNYFFWTWKIGNSTGAIEQVNPFWNYQLGLKNGWIPSDPRSAVGTCAGDLAALNEFDGTFSSAWMTGGVGANTIEAAMSTLYPWPANSFANIEAAYMPYLPQYTQTATPITMPGPTYTSPGSSATIFAGNGWFNPTADARNAYTAVAGCSYPPEYSAALLPVPTSACGAGMVQPTRRDSFPAPTPAPAR
ncbi:MAG: hypothetical protein TREMPRED_000085 [Tremellales sp. Tagirdzhanova-0007]|nr:MAG: hypothetical protein TREMPRED_000085 [Tremellales sp. Tagirdzhanova-0007]